MIRLICKSCGKVWYTANTRYIPKCDDCGGELEEKEVEINRGIEEQTMFKSGSDNKAGI